MQTISWFSVKQKRHDNDVGELIEAFAKVGLDISVDKCAWSSYPPERQGTLNVGGFNLKWVKSLTFVGAVINFSGNDGEAIMDRLAQAAKSLGAWRKCLRSPRVALKKRLKLLFSTVFASALWLSETVVANETAERTFVELECKDGILLCGLLPWSRLSECSSILESTSSQRARTPCDYG